MKKKASSNSSGSSNKHNAKSVWPFILVIIILLATAAYFYYRPQLPNFSAKSYQIKKLALEDSENLTLDKFTALDNVKTTQAQMLVNKEHKLAENYEPELDTYKDTGLLMNVNMIPKFAEMGKFINEQYDEKLYVSSSYRTAQEQAEIISEGNQDATEVGASEHETGLALDVYVYQFAGQAFIKHEVGQYVNQNCQDYGFIIRYGKNKQNITGVHYEPWHIRYVGLPHAKIIAANNLALEEYISSFEPGKFYQVEVDKQQYIISRQSVQKNGEITVPLDFAEASISPDNTGYYFLTFKLS